MSKNLVFVFLATTGLAACGSGDKDITLAQFIEDVSASECASVAQACRINEVECTATRQDYWSKLAADAMATGRPFDPKHADNCIAKVKSVYGTLDRNLAISARDYRDQKRVCERVFHGPAKENQPCVTAVDCIDDLVCDKGFCGNSVEVGEGKQCANIGEYCAQGFTCAQMGAGPVMQCMPRAAKGAGCIDDKSCLEALRCVGSVCTDGLPSPSACQTDDDCASGFCEPFAHECGTDIRFASGSSSCSPFRSPGAVVPVAGGDAGTD